MDSWQFVYLTPRVRLINANIMDSPHSSATSAAMPVYHSLGTRPSKNRNGGSGKQGGVEVYTAEC